MKLLDLKHDRRWARAVCLLSIALLQFCLFLNRRDITTAHEGRVAATAREMLFDRHQWLIPYCNTEPRVLKPPLAYWAAMGTWKLAGNRCDVWLARLPAAMCGAIGVLLIMDLGRRTLGRGGDLVCGALWISTWFIVDEYRKAMADPYLAFFVLLSLWAWIVAEQAAHAGAPRRRVADLLFVLCYASAGVAALAKGHLVLIHLPVLIVPYQWLWRRRSPSRPMAHGLGIVLMLAIALPWFVYIARHVPDSVAEWKENAGGANATAGPKLSAWFHYVINFPVLTAPWTVFTIIGLLTAVLVPRRRDRRHRWALVALALAILVFSFVPMKKNAYLLPMMPAAILVTAAPILSILRTRNPQPIDRLLFAGHAIAAGVALCATLFVVLRLPIVELEAPGPMMATGAIALFLLLGASTLSPRLMSVRTFALTALAFALAVHGVEGWIWPEQDNRRSDAPLAHAAINLAPQGPLMVVGGGLREDVLFYLGRTVPVLDSAKLLPEWYKGLAIVTSDEFPALESRGDVLSNSSERPPHDKLYLMQFPRQFEQRKGRDR